MIAVLNVKCWPKGKVGLNLPCWDVGTKRGGQTTCTRSWTPRNALETAETWGVVVRCSSCPADGVVYALSWVHASLHRAARNGRKVRDPGIWVQEDRAVVGKERLECFFRPTLSWNLAFFGSWIFNWQVRKRQEPLKLWKALTHELVSPRAWQPVIFFSSWRSIKQYASPFEKGLSTTDAYSVSLLWSLEWARRARGIRSEDLNTQHLQDKRTFIQVSEW